jgi:hypothetical protein
MFQHQTCRGFWDGDGGAVMPSLEEEMEQSIQVAVNTVKKYIDNADESQSYMVFLNRHGEIDIVSKDTDDEVFVRLPYFEIIRILVGGCLFIPLNKFLPEVSDEELKTAILKADNNRQQFYEERAEEFGPAGKRMKAAADVAIRKREMTYSASIPTRTVEEIAAAGN